MTAKLHMVRGEGTAGQPALSPQWLRGTSIAGQLWPCLPSSSCVWTFCKHHIAAGVLRSCWTLNTFPIMGFSVAIDLELNSLFWPLFVSIWGSSPILDVPPQCELRL